MTTRVEIRKKMTHCIAATVSSPQKPVRVEMPPVKEATAAVGSDDQGSPDAASSPAQPPYGWLLPSAFWTPGWSFSSHAAHLPFYFWLVDAIRPHLLVDLVSG